MKSRSLFLTVIILVAVAAPGLARGNEALRLVPADSVTVGMVQLSELRDSPLAGRIFRHADQITGDGDAEAFLRQAGFNPGQDIDTIVFTLSPGEEGKHPDPLLIVEGRFEVARISEALLTRGATKTTIAAGTYFHFPQPENDGGAVAFLNARLAVAGREAAVAEAMGAYATGGTDFEQAGGLAHLLGAVDRGANAWMLVDVPRAQRLKGETRLPGRRNDAMEQALRDVSAVAVWAEDTGDKMNLGAIANSNDPEMLQLLEDLARGMLATWRLAAQEKAPELVSEIRSFQVDRGRGSISLRGSISAETIEKFAKKHAEKQLGK